MTIAYVLTPSRDHQLSGHPEHPQRFDHFGRLQEYPFASKLLLEIPSDVDRDVILAVHPSQYLDSLEESSRRGEGFLDYGDTYVTSASYQSALQAVGGATAMVDAVINGKANSGFAIVRPPGHHATASRAMGFCLLNNVAIAARYAQSKGLARVMIIDFDVHHGNGTQDIFETDPNVYYLSTHQGGIFPGTGHIHEVGRGDGEMTNLNIPLPPGAGDLAFNLITESIIIPAAMRFIPQILLISAGFDAHWCDPLASLQLTTSGYYEIGKVLIQLSREVCNGRIAFVLEGGYDPEALTDNIAAVFASMAGEPPPADRLGPAPYPEPDIRGNIEEIRLKHDL